jgi:hypothetical protein
MGQNKNSWHYPVRNLLVDIQLQRPSSVFQELDLTPFTPLAAGSERQIYQHPLEPSLLIKVIVHPKRKANAIPAGRRNKAFHREDVYTVFQSELVEYVATEIQSKAHGNPVPMARIAGFAHTSLGLGLVVEKITDGDGNMAPTLKQLVEQRGFDASLQQQLEEFFSILALDHVIFNDVGGSNIVYGCNAAGRHGMYLVDGFGIKQVIPVYAWSKTLNRRRLIRKYPEIVAELRRAERQPATLAHGRNLQANLVHAERASGITQQSAL